MRRKAAVPAQAVAYISGYWLPAFVGMTLLSGVALAAPTSELKDTGVQTFKKESCVSEPDAFFDECTCEVQIKYHVIGGQDEVNKVLAPDADLRSYCSGIFQVSSDEKQNADAWKPAEKTQGDTSVYQFTSVQEITYLSDDWLGVLTQDYVYSGGAHGNTGLSSALYDLKAHAAVPYTQVINIEAVAAANAAIQQQLDAKKDDVFEEFLHVKEPSYIKADGSCEACIYVLREDGLHAMFQQYAVAPYSSGVIDVKLPMEFVKSPWNATQKGN